MNDSDLEADKKDGRDRGATLVEYALLVAFIAVACFVAVQFLGQRTSSGFNDAGSSIFTTTGS